MSLLDDIAVTRVEETRFTADLPERWSFFKPSGGVLMSVGLGAMRDLFPGEDVLSATAVFCTPVDAGRLSIDVEILRRGATVSQARASVRSGSGPGLEILATFGRARDKYPDVVEAEMPDVPRYDALGPAPPNTKWRMRFFENFEHRLAFGHFSWEPGDWEPGPARYARWLRYVEKPAREGRVDPLAYPPILDLMPPALIHKVGKREGQFFAPSLDLTVHFYEPSDREWFLVSGLCRRAQAGTASAQVELFDDTGRLVAYATQVMFLKRSRG